VGHPGAADVVRPLQTIGVIHAYSASQRQAVVIHNCNLGPFPEWACHARQLSFTVAEDPSDDFACHNADCRATTLPAAIGQQFSTFIAVIDYRVEPAM